MTTAKHQFREERRILERCPTREDAKELIIQRGMGWPHWLGGSVYPASPTKGLPIDRIWKLLKKEVALYEKYG